MAKFCYFGQGIFENSCPRERNGRYPIEKREEKAKRGFLEGFRGTMTEDERMNEGDREKASQNSKLDVDNSFSSLTRTCFICFFFPISSNPI